MRKRYLLQVAAVNLGLVMRSLFGRGTPRQEAEARKGHFVLVLLFWAALDAVRRLAARAASAFHLAARQATADPNRQLRAVGA